MSNIQHQHLHEYHHQVTNENLCFQGGRESARTNKKEVKKTYLQLRKRKWMLLIMIPDGMRAEKTLDAPKLKFLTIV